MNKIPIPSAETRGPCTGPINSFKTEKFSPDLTVIPEVSLPATLNAKGKTPLQYERQIQHWVGRHQSEPQTFPNRTSSSSGATTSGYSFVERHPTTTETVAQLTNQIYLDNGEMFYVLVTDVTSYILNSKPEIWSENNTNSTYLAQEGLLEKCGGKLETVAFNCLFHIGSEIFILFLFSPMDITFVLDLPGSSAQGNNKMTNVFFHGNSCVYVTSTGNNGNEDQDITKTITIQFEM